MRLKAWLLPAVLALAVAPRVVGIDFGFPHLYHPDEPIYISHALNFASGDFNPHWATYPHFFMYLLFACDALYFLALKLTGVAADAGEFGLIYILHPWKFYLIGRVLSLLFGLGGVACLFFGVEALAGKRAGAAAALALAANAVHINESRIAVADVPVCFFICLCVMFLCFFHRERRWKWFYLAAASASLGVATKYNAGFLIFSLAPALIFPFRTEPFTTKIRTALTAAVLGAAVLFLASPYLFLDFPELKSSLANLGVYFEEGWLGSETDPNRLAPVYGAYVASFGGPLALASALGAAFLILRGHALAAYFTVTGLAAFFYMGKNNYFNPHWILIAVPFGCVALGLFYQTLHERAATRGPGAAAALTAAALLGAAIPFGAGLREGVVIRREDTRTDALRWAAANLPLGAFIATESWGPPFGVERGEIEKKLKEAEATGSPKADFLKTRLEKGAFTPFRLFNINANEEVEKFNEKLRDPTYYDLDMLKEMGVEYVTINETMYGRLKKVPERYRKQNEFYNALDEFAELVKEFPSSASRPGPTVKFYKIQ